MAIELCAEELKERLQFLYDETRNETVRLGIKQAQLAVEDMIREQDIVYEGLHAEDTQKRANKLDA